MKKLLILALSSITLFSTLTLANPEAENIGGGAKASAAKAGSEVRKALIVRVDQDGKNKSYYQYTGNVLKMPELIAKFQAGEKVTGFKKVKDETLVSSKSPKNLEAEGDVAQQSWFYHRQGYRYGHNPGHGYYNGYWPSKYYYSYARPVYSTYHAPVYNYWAPSYRWSCGYSNYTWSIYW